MYTWRGRCWWLSTLSVFDEDQYYHVLFEPAQREARWMGEYDATVAGVLRGRRARREPTGWYGQTLAVDVGTDHLVLTTYRPAGTHDDGVEVVVGEPMHLPYVVADRVADDLDAIASRVAIVDLPRCYESAPSSDRSESFAMALSPRTSPDPWPPRRS